MRNLVRAGAQFVGLWQVDQLVQDLRTVVALGGLGRQEPGFRTGLLGNKKSMINSNEPNNS